MANAIRCRGAKICSPFVSRDPLDDTIYYVSADTSEVFAARPSLAASDAHKSIAFTGGEPYGAQFDRLGRLHVADAAHAALLRVDDNGQPGVLVRMYEERAFRGPSAITFGASDADASTLYFTDSGPLGETTLEKPHGSVFSISTSASGGQILRPLALKCLAHPCGVATTLADPTVVYVVEMMQNRVLRLSQRPGGGGAYHMSVFHQFVGGMGPSCVACDATGRVFVGHYDFAGSGSSRMRGKISVLAPDGVLQHTLHVQGAEVSGICLRQAAKSSADESAVIVTEASANVIYQLPVPQ